jgi:hypothetical protein
VSDICSIFLQDWAGFYLHTPLSMVILSKLPVFNAQRGTFAVNDAGSLRNVGCYLVFLKIDNRSYPKRSM